MRQYTVALAQDRGHLTLDILPRPRGALLHGAKDSVALTRIEAGRLLGLSRLAGYQITRTNVCPGGHNNSDVWCEHCGHGLPRELEDDPGQCPCCGTYLPAR